MVELIQFRCYDDPGQFLQVLLEIFCNFLAIFVIFLRPYLFLKLLKFWEQSGACVLLFQQWEGTLADVHIILQLGLRDGERKPDGRGRRAVKVSWLVTATQEEGRGQEKNEVLGLRGDACTLIQHGQYVGWKEGCVNTKRLKTTKGVKVRVGVPWNLSGKEAASQCRRLGFNLQSGKVPQATERLSLCTTAAEPVLQSLGAATPEAQAPGVHALQQEKPLQWEAPTQQLEESPRSKEGSAQPKTNKLYIHSYIYICVCICIYICICIYM